MEFFFLFFFFFSFYRPSFLFGSFFLSFVMWKITIWLDHRCHVGWRDTILPIYLISLTDIDLISVLLLVAVLCFSWCLALILPNPGRVPVGCWILGGLDWIGLDGWC